jgi:hypothetical protein
MGLNAQQIAWRDIVDAARPAPPPFFLHARQLTPADRQPGPGAVLPVRLPRSPHARHAGVAPLHSDQDGPWAFLFRPCSCCGRPVPLERWHDGQPGCDECNRVEAERRAEWRLRIGLGLALGATIAVAGLGWASLFRWLGWW